jgi:hypothetical protein
MEDIQIKSHNPKFKENLAKTIEYLYESDKVVDYLKIGYINMAPWATEKSDNNIKIKYIGQPYWSKNAIEHFKIYGINGLRHEHVIPNKIIREKLNSSKKGFNEIFEILDKLAHAVIVTKEEASELDRHFKYKLPDNINFQISNNSHFLFSRYIEFNKLNDAKKIEIFFLNEEQRNTSKSIKSLEFNVLKKIL